MADENAGNPVRIAKGPTRVAPYPLVALSGLVVLGASLALSFWTTVQGQELAFVDDVAVAATKVIAGLAVIALILERGLAVFDDLLFGPVRSAADGEDATLEEALQVDVARERARLILGLMAGLLLSAAGVRTLAGLVTPRLDAFQTGVDIWLTAGLLAGGSNGLAKLVDVLRESAAAKKADLRLARSQANLQRRSLGQTLSG